jgi:hypothetical protein
MNNSSDLEDFENRELEGIKGCPLQRSAARCVFILRFIKGVPGFFTCLYMSGEVYDFYSFSPEYFGCTLVYINMK